MQAAICGSRGPLCKTQFGLLNLMAISGVYQDRRRRQAHVFDRTMKHGAIAEVLAGNVAHGIAIKSGTDGVGAPMKSLKRDILSALVMCAIAVALALAWGSPFVEAAPAHAQDSEPLQRLIHKLPLKAKPHPGTPSAAANR
jgi:hypothetical protein